MPVRLPNSLRTALATAVLTAIDTDAGAGKIEVRSGTQPATGDTAATGTLLATIVLADPAGTVATGVLTFTDPAAVSAVAAGTASWFRLMDNSGDTVLDGDVTATGGGGQLQLATTALTVGLSVDVTSFTITMPAS